MKKPVHRFAVATADPEFQAAFKLAVAESEKPAAVVLNRPSGEIISDTEKLADDLRKSEANVLVVDIGSRDKTEVGDEVKALVTEVPGMRVVLVGHPASAPELLDLMRAGVSDYLAKPVENGALPGALERATRGLSHSPGDLGSGKQGRVIGLLGPKGGTGVTTLATNLAIKLRQLTETEVLLADLNAELGTASILLGVRPRYNFVELVKNLHRMDEDLLRSYVTRHDSGIGFLPSPLTARDLEGVTKQRINATMKMLKADNDHVVLDLGNAMTPLAQTALSMCDEVVIVITPEVPCLRNAKRMLPNVAQSVPGGERSLRFVVNRYDSKTDIPLGQIRDTLGKDVSVALPRVDIEAVEAANVGRPMAVEGVPKYDKVLVRVTTDLAAPGSIVAAGKRSGSGLLGLLRPQKGKGPKKKGSGKIAGSSSTTPATAAGSKN